MSPLILLAGLIAGTPGSDHLGVARASDIIGSEICNESQEKIGKVEDLVMHPSRDIVAVVEREGGDLLGIPLSLLTPVTKAGAESAEDTKEIEKFVYAGDADKLASAPAIAERIMITDLWTSRCHEHFIGATGSGDDKDRSTCNLSGPVCIDEFLGTDVKTAAGEELADVKDVVVDLHNADVAYVVISSGGALGIGGRLHGVSLDSMKYDPVSQSVTIDTDRATLERTPSLDLDRLPSRPNLQLSAMAPADRGGEPVVRGGAPR